MRSACLVFMVLMVLLSLSGCNEHGSGAHPKGDAPGEVDTGEAGENQPVPAEPINGPVPADELQAFLIRSRRLLAEIGSYPFDPSSCRSGPVCKYLKENCKTSRSSSMGSGHYSNSSRVFGDSCGIAYESSGSGKHTIPTQQKAQFEFNWDSSRDPVAISEIESFKQGDKSQGRENPDGSIEETLSARFRIKTSLGLFVGSEMRQVLYRPLPSGDLVGVVETRTQDITGPGFQAHVSANYACELSEHPTCTHSYLLNGAPISRWDAWMVRD